MTTDDDLSIVNLIVSSAVRSWLTSIATGGTHWLESLIKPEAEDYTLPLVVVAPGSRGELRRYVSGEVIFRGPFVVRCVHEDQEQADAFARAVAVLVPDKTTFNDPEGGPVWDIVTTVLPPPVPGRPANRSAQNVLAYRFELERRSA